MVTVHDRCKVFRVHGGVYIVGVSSIIFISLILWHTQTDIWQAISSNYVASNWTYSHVFRGNLTVSTHHLGNGTFLQGNGFGAASATSVQTAKPATYRLIQEEKAKLRAHLNFATGTPQTFELVEGVSSNLYVYGALWNNKKVRLISIKVQGYDFRNLQCVLYYSVDNNSTGLYVRPVIKELHTYKSPYTSASITCPVDPDRFKDRIPLFVGLVESSSAKPKKTFIVENRGQADGETLEKAGYKFEFPQREVVKEFTVCIPAMFGWKNAAMIVEKIEMSRILGAGRVVLYNASTYPNVDAVLRMYTREWAQGNESLEVVVMPWKLPMEDGKLINIPYWAQQLAIDDCMYRYKRLSHYMVFDDLDEFAIPLQHDNWSTLIAERRRLNPRSIGWLFRCCFVSKDRPSPGVGFEQDSLQFGSLILGLTSREQYVYPSNDRAKLIVDPTTIEEMGVHLIWEGGGITDNLPLNVGLLYHYRIPSHACQPQEKDTRVIDKYGKRLLARLKDIWSKLPGVDTGWEPVKAADTSMCPNG